MEPLTAAVLALALAVLVILAATVLRRKQLPPGPWLSLPVLGDLPFLGLEPVKFHLHRFLKYGPIYKVKFLSVDMYVVGDVAALRPILQKGEGTIFDVPVPSFEHLMDDLDYMKVSEVHSCWRKLMLLELSPAALESKFDLLKSIILPYVSAWCEAGHLNVWEQANQLSYEIGIEFMGLRPLLTKTPVPWLKNEMKTFCDGLYGVPFNLPGTPMRAAHESKARCIQALSDEVQGLLKEVKEVAATASLRGTSSQGADSAASAKASSTALAGSDLVSLPSPHREPREVMDSAQELLGSKGRLTLMHAQLAGVAMLKEVDVPDVVRLLMHTAVAASDTTRFAIEHVLVVLGLCSPDMQERLYEEQQKVIRDHGPELTHAVVHNEMPLLEATIKEVMRLLPASGGGFRRVVQDTHLCGYTLPKGSLLWFSAHLLNATDPLLWNGKTLTKNGVPPHMDLYNLDQSFKPDRWLSEETKPRHYYTFGYGNHLCLGQNLVYLELKIMLAALIRRAKWRMDLDASALLKRAIKMPLKLAAGTDGCTLTLRA